MATPSIDPSFYADFGGLTALKKDVKDKDPNAIRKAAQQFESLFTEMMLKSMREAKLGEGLGESDQTDFYQDMYDQQLSLEISRGKGLGLADMLVQQLTRSGLVHGAGATGAAGTPGTAAHGGSGVRAGAAHELSAPGTKTVKDRERISFIRALTPYAQRAGALLGISPDSLIGQAALETGWGEHIPASADGRSSNNLFGVKAGADFRGASLRASTTEYLGA